MDLGLKDKVALVTGAGSQTGFGKGIALALAREGCDVIILDKDGAGAEKTAAAVEATGRKALARLGGIERVHFLITDDGIDDGSQRAFEKAGVEVIVASGGQT